MQQCVCVFILCLSCVFVNVCVCLYVCAVLSTLSHVYNHELIFSKPYSSHLFIIYSIAERIPARILFDMDLNRNLSSSSLKTMRKKILANVRVELLAAEDALFDISREFEVARRQEVILQETSGERRDGNYFHLTIDNKVVRKVFSN